MFYKLRASGYKCDQTAYDKLINGFSMQGDLDTAQNLFEEMASNNLVPNASNFENMIYGEMSQTGHLPSVVTYICLIGGFCKANWMDIAHLLADEMRRKKVSPDVFSYNVLIAGYRRLGNLDRAHELFKEMRKEGIFPNDYTFNILELDAASVKEN
ncbi:hypothetical protein HYC85_026928 [Camellia sinensis]|uniref:Pentacotripeptide-repeat region of PRORP domain-containing protein n=1 Tax=Camellia sinensis TaxID=4442 RepID=A0A7J7G512_CAMSI|nr:hypothetical protein HYC85_026928 [Camellia sinensis]